MALAVLARGQKFIVERDPTWPSGQLRATLTLHDQHYLDEFGQWQGVVEGFAADTLTGFTSLANRLRHALHVADDGTRRWYPRRNITTEYVQFGVLQYYTGAAWQNVPLGTPTRSGNTITWDQAHFALKVTVIWKRVKIEVTLKDSTAAHPVRWAVTLVGLTWNNWTLISQSDSTVVGTVDKPYGWDANGSASAPNIAVTPGYSGGYVTLTATLAGAVYPVVIDPTLTTPQDNTIGCTTILSGAADNNYGARANVFAGAVFGVGDAKVLLLFDLSSITAGSTCDSANLHVFRETSTGGSHTLNVYPVASGNNGWPEGVQTGGTPGAGENGCTWNYFNNNGTVAWAGSAGCSTAGTDYENSALGSGTINGADATGTEYNISLTGTTRIAAMFGAGGTNYGFAAWIDYAEYQYLCSDDYGTAGYRPYLVVTYTTGTTYTRSCTRTGTVAQTLVRQAINSRAVTRTGTVAQTLAATKTLNRSVSRTGSVSQSLARVGLFGRAVTRVGSILTTLIYNIPGKSRVGDLMLLKVGK